MEPRELDEKLAQCYIAMEPRELDEKLPQLVDSHSLSLIQKLSAESQKQIEVTDELIKTSIFDGIIDQVRSFLYVVNHLVIFIYFSNMFPFVCYRIVSV